jgi:hypothetical protein
MKAKATVFLLADLGVTKSHSWPHTSNDNPFSESHFKTMKYQPQFPKRSALSRTPRASAVTSSIGITANTTISASAWWRRIRCTMVKLTRFTRRVRALRIRHFREIQAVSLTKNPNRRKSPPQFGSIRQSRSHPFKPKLSNRSSHCRWHVPERLFAFLRLPSSQWKLARTTNAIERLHEEFKRRIKTQTVLPSAETAGKLFWALLASSQITIRKVNGWQSLAEKIAEPQTIDLAA